MWQSSKGPLVHLIGRDVSDKPISVGMKMGG